MSHACEECGKRGHVVSQWDGYRIRHWHYPCMPKAAARLKLKSDDLLDDYAGKKIARAVATALEEVAGGRRNLYAYVIAVVPVHHSASPSIVSNMTKRELVAEMLASAARGAGYVYVEIDRKEMH